jgi:hypothetical protein
MYNLPQLKKIYIATQKPEKKHFEVQLKAQGRKENCIAGSRRFAGHVSHVFLSS